MDAKIQESLPQFERVRLIHVMQKKKKKMFSFFVEKMHLSYIYYTDIICFLLYVSLLGERTVIYLDIISVIY